MKLKLSVIAILSSSAIAASLLFGSVSSVQSCAITEFKNTQTTTDSQPNWFHSPWSILITLPGIALATGLSLAGRTYDS